MKHSAYIVGGSPDALRSLKVKLASEGIDMAGKAETVQEITDAIPKAATFVLLLADMCSHSLGDKARLLAGVAGVPVVMGSAYSWSKTRTRLGEKKMLNSELPTTIGERLSEEKKAQLYGIEPEKKEPPKEEVVEKKKYGSSGAAKYARIHEVAEKVFAAHKDHIETYTNVEAALEASQLLGYDVSPSAMRDHRADLGVSPIRKGYKRPRKPLPTTAKKKHVELPSAKMQVRVLEGDAEQEFDQIKSFLEDWVYKHKVSKVYVALDNGVWEVNWEQVTVVQHGKKYGKKG